MKKFLATTLISSMMLLALNTGEVPPKVVISEKNGGYLDGTEWNSSMLKNKLYVLFYVDPDERDTNSAFTEVLKNKNYDLNYYGSVAIINLAATWLPNVVLESKLKDKQKKFPNTIYVKDKSKVLVKEWNLQDDSSNVLVFNKSGELIYSYSGKLDSSEITKVISLIDRNLI
jgi:predicted transcriptional regulator